MSIVAVVEGLAWLISIVLAGWMVLDMVRVARRNDERALVDAPDPLDEVPAGVSPGPASGAGAPDDGRAS